MLTATHHARRKGAVQRKSLRSPDVALPPPARQSPPALPAANLPTPPPIARHPGTRSVLPRVRRFLRRVFPTCPLSSGFSVWVRTPSGSLDETAPSRTVPYLFVRALLPRSRPARCTTGYEPVRLLTAPLKPPSLRELWREVTSARSGRDGAGATAPPPLCPLRSLLWRPHGVRSARSMLQSRT